MREADGADKGVLLYLQVGKGGGACAEGVQRLALVCVAALVVGASTLKFVGCGLVRGAPPVQRPTHAHQSSSTLDMHGSRIQSIWACGLHQAGLQSAQQLAAILSLVK